LSTQRDERQTQSSFARCWQPAQQSARSCAAFSWTSAVYFGNGRVVPRQFILTSVQGRRSGRYSLGATMSPRTSRRSVVMILSCAITVRGREVRGILTSSRKPLAKLLHRATRSSGLRRWHHRRQASRSTWRGEDSEGCSWAAENHAAKARPSNPSLETLSVYRGSTP
jgi:hypothetical protein